MKYRKKPVVVEAVQLVVDPAGVGLNISEIGDLVGEDRVASVGCEIAIWTPRGVMAALPGDWIIRGVAGEVCLCKPEIFRQTYEPVEEAEV